MKRIFICAESGFPRVGACSNYIEYLSLAFLESGYKVIVLGLGNVEETHFLKSEYGYDYKKINFILFPNKLAKNTITFLKKHQIDSNDILVFYAKKARNIFPVMNYCHKNKIATVNCVVEWHNKNQYGKTLKERINYIDYCIGFYILNPKIKNILAISSYLENYFNKRKCNSLRLPILANPFEFPYNLSVSDKIKFIYSGNGKNKDRIDSIIKCFLSLDKVEKEKFELHLTGMSEEFIQDIIKENDIKGDFTNMVIHPWLEYKELVQLFQNMDFVFILRDKSKTTMSNFPSKIPEMMSYGIVPIVSDVGDYTKYYLKDSENSIVVDGATYKDGLNAIERISKLSETEILTLKKNARKTIEKEFYYKNWTEKIKEFLEKVK